MGEERAGAAKLTTTRFEAGLLEPRQERSLHAMRSRVTNLLPMSGPFHCFVSEWACLQVKGRNGQTCVHCVSIAMKVTRILGGRILDRFFETTCTKQAFCCLLNSMVEHSVSLGN